MSTHRSYFSKNNTLIAESLANTGRNPVIDLYFGSALNTIAPAGFTRFIFDLDLIPLLEKIVSGVISTECSNSMTHTLNLTNTIRFDDDLLNAYNSDMRRRATSFDLILFRIPNSCYQQSGSVLTTTTTLPCNPVPQNWDEGVGYDYINTKKAINVPTGFSVSTQPKIDKNYSTRPSNWYQTDNLDFWSEPGMYNNKNESSYVNYNNLEIIDIQHFDYGNEDINFDMTDEINGILNGTITGVTGWGIAFRPDFELISGLTSNYSVSFFSRHTQTFYEPYLLTTYNDLIEDDRNLFVEKIQNKLYLFAYIDGELVNLDENPTVKILDANGEEIPGLNNIPSCPRTKGVYEAVIPPISGYTTPCQFTDLWSNIIYQGVRFPDIENEFILQPYKNRLIIGPESREPSIFGFDFYGIKQDEKILNTEIRKVGVVIKKAYSTAQLLQNVEAYYRVYVREGETEVQVQDWTKINRSPNEYFFMFDTVDKIPNEYFIDIKVNTSGVTDIYKRTIKFMIVNKK
jgi:hypothetical protein